MKPEYMRQLANKLKLEKKSYREIAEIMGISKESVRNLCRYRLKENKNKSGPKFKLHGINKYNFNRKVVLLKNAGEKVTSTKIQKSMCIKLSRTTCWRYLNRRGYKYTTSKKQLSFRKENRKNRIMAINEWIKNRQDWSKVVFSDEKRFSLDGPDNFGTYILKNESNIKYVKEYSGGGVFIWAMLMPNGLISYTSLGKKFDSRKYVEMLQTKVLPILNLNFGNDFIFQEDNWSVHKAKIVRDFYETSGVNILKWPAQSPDINLTEDIWHMISEIVYDGPTFQNLTQLELGIKNAINFINSNCRNKLLRMYHDYSYRLCKILVKKGGLYNKY